jgi:hypothetical protein
VRHPRDHVPQLAGALRQHARVGHVPFVRLIHDRDPVVCGQDERPDDCYKPRATVT